MYLSIIILPLLQSIVTGFFGREVGIKASQFITCFCVIITTLQAGIAFIEIGFNNTPLLINLAKWVDSE
jgi:NADH-ubiquinone oxidoreductase chain 5